MYGREPLIYLHGTAKPMLLNYNLGGKIANYSPIEMYGKGSTNLFAWYSQTNELIIEEALFRERKQVSRSFHEVGSQLH